MKWLVVLLTLNNLAYAACNPVTIKGEELCFDPARQSYLSKSCKTVLECFPFEKGLEIRPNQSPGFTLCYNLKGDPFFEKPKGSARSLSFCRKNNKTVDINTLLLFHGPRRPKI